VKALFFLWMKVTLDRRRTSILLTNHPSLNPAATPNHQPSTPKNMNSVITFNTNGTGSCLYTELIDLHSIGGLEVSRASTIEFNNQNQHWEVKDRRGALLFFARSRQACLEWEHGNL
jgi:hypothetical protein